MKGIKGRGEVSGEYFDACLRKPNKQTDTRNTNMYFVEDISVSAFVVVVVYGVEYLFILCLSRNHDLFSAGLNILRLLN